jgi:hypothetical protein
MILRILIFWGVVSVIAAQSVRIESYMVEVLNLVNARTFISCFAQMVVSTEDSSQRFFLLFHRSRRDWITTTMFKCRFNFRCVTAVQQYGVHAANESLWARWFEFL